MMNPPLLTPKYDTVMIIDDNNIDLYIASRVIQKAGFADNVLRYTSAREALQYLKEHTDRIPKLPEVIFVDIYMPDMSGFEFMAAYDGLAPKLKEHCHAYIISSSLDENDIARAHKDKNVVAFHEKPITAEFLQNVLGQC
jgi:CheY-like chemotaxis protein